MDNSNKCIECKKIIDFRSKRCIQCASKIHGLNEKGINNPNYIDGRTLNKKEEQLKCFNYKNLRPLWKEDNQNRPKQGKY